MFPGRVDRETLVVWGLGGIPHTGRVVPATDIRDGYLSLRRSMRSFGVADARAKTIWRDPVIVRASFES